MKVKAVLVLLLTLFVSTSMFAVVIRKSGPGEGPRVVRVQPAPAPREGRKPNWWGPGAPNQTPVVQGNVTNVGQDNITLSLPEGAQTFAVTPQTEIMVEGKKAGLGDIKQGDPCVLKMQLVPQGFPIALAIRARPVDAPPAVKMQSAAGAVAEAAPDHIVINTSKGAQGFAVNAQTRVYVYGKKASIGNVKVGAQAEVSFVPREGAPLAMRISVVYPRFEGMVTEINGNVLTIKSKDAVRTVTVVADTKITFKDRAAILADVKTGYRVIAMGNVSGSSMTAAELRILPPMRKGVVTAISGNQLTIATTECIIITGQLSDQTVITVRPRVGPNRQGAPSDIKVESVVNVSGPMLDAGPYQGGTMQLMSVDIFVAQ